MVPSLVNTAWAVVTQLVKDWQKNPSMLWTEHDIQAELYSRLKNTLVNLGAFYVKDRPNEKTIEKKSEHLRPRLNCEYSIFYDSEGKRSTIKPDIVLWDDLDSTKYPNIDDRYSAIKNGKDNWPILWACEIKYISNIAIERTNLHEVKRWFREGKEEKSFNWDVDKMNTLVTYGEKGVPYFGTQYACVLNLVKICAPGNGLYWDTEFKREKGKLWMLHAYLPENEFFK